MPAGGAGIAVWRARGGTVMPQGEAQSLAARLWQWVRAVLIRELSF